MTTKQPPTEDFDKLLEQLKKNPQLRETVIKALARDFPGEFLAPVRLQSNAEGRRLSTIVVSCKEWQE